jgi:hypothetical protein
MRYWKTIHPDENGNVVVGIYSDRDILDKYWEYWKRKMSLVNKEHLINKERCIEDWVTDNWAHEIKKNHIM